MAKNDELKNFENELIKAMKPHVDLNQGDNLPFGFYHPESDGKTTWMCGPDHLGTITSVFCNEENGNREKVVYQTVTTPRGSEKNIDIDEAKKIRDILISNGWKKIVPPEVRFKFKGDDQAKPLNRRKKRLIRQYIKNMKKENPFDSSDKTDLEKNV